MTTTTKSKVFEEVTIKMRLGVADDFKKEVHKLNEGGFLETKSVPNNGQPYFIKSIEKQKFDNRNYQISEDTDWAELRDYIRRKMIYVPAGYFELLKADEL